jgi:hypothetical protein
MCVFSGRRNLALLSWHCFFPFFSVTGKVPVEEPGGGAGSDRRSTATVLYTATHMMAVTACFVALARVFTKYPVLLLTETYKTPGNKNGCDRHRVIP